MPDFPAKAGISFQRRNHTCCRHTPQSRWPVIYFTLPHPGFYLNLSAGKHLENVDMQNKLAITTLSLAIFLAGAADSQAVKNPLTHQTTTTTTTAPAPQINSPQQMAEIERTFATWINYVSLGSPDKVASLYRGDAVFMPTLSNKICDTPEKRREYLDKLTSLKNLKVSVSDVHIKTYGNTATNSGFYTFNYDNGLGGTITLAARYSFVYELTPQGWLIVSHHSSKLPETN